MTPNGASVLLECSTVLWALMAVGASNCRIVIHTITYNHIHGYNVRLCLLKGPKYIHSAITHMHGQRGIISHELPKLSAWLIF